MQLLPMVTLLPIKTLGCIIVFIPIVAESETLTVDAINGLKCLVILLKSLKGSSEINKALPSGQSTLLLIKMIVAAEFKALS